MIKTLEKKVLSLIVPIGVCLGFLVNNLEAQTLKQQTQTDSSYVKAISDGKYSIPIKSSSEALIRGIGDEGIKWDFIERHSNQKLWTYEFIPVSFLPNIETGKMEKPEIGMDKFYRKWGNELAQINIVWSPIEIFDVQTDFNSSILFHEALNIWIKGSEKQIYLDGNEAFYGKFKVSFESVKMYSIFMITHANNRRYQIQYSYTKSFSDPENTFEKIKQIKFLKDK